MFCQLYLVAYFLYCLKKVHPCLLSIKKGSQIATWLEFGNLFPIIRPFVVNRAIQIYNMTSHLGVK